MKWIGQHIWDLISRFRSTVYFENLETSSETNVLVVDGDGKVTKNSAAAGDVTEVVAGDGLTGGGASGSVTVNVGAGTGIDVAADAISVDVSDFLTGGTGSGSVADEHPIVVATSADTMEAKSKLVYSDPGYGWSFLKMKSLYADSSYFRINSTNYANTEIKTVDGRAQDHEADIIMIADGLMKFESYFGMTMDSKSAINLDSETENIVLKADGNERIHFLLDSTPTMEVTGGFDIDCSGDIEINAGGGDVNFKNGSSQLANISSAGLSFVDNTGAGIIFEGTTDDSYNTTLTAADTTSSSKTITLPDATGTVALTSDIPTVPDESPTTGQNLTLKYLKKTLTKANMEVLHTGTTGGSFAGKLLDAPGSNLQIIPTDIWLFIDDDGTINNANQNLILGYGGTTNFTEALHIYKRFHYHFSGSSHDSSVHMPPYTPEYALNISDGINESLTLTLDAALTANSVTSMQVHLTYYIIDRS